MDSNIFKNFLFFGSSIFFFCRMSFVIFLSFQCSFSQLLNALTENSEWIEFMSHCGPCVCAVGNLGCDFLFCWPWMCEILLTKQKPIWLKCVYWAFIVWLTQSNAPSVCQCKKAPSPWKICFEAGSLSIESCSCFSDDTCYVLAQETSLNITSCECMVFSGQK